MAHDTATVGYSDLVQVYCLNTVERVADVNNVDGLLSRNFEVGRHFLAVLQTPPHHDKHRRERLTKALGIPVEFWSKLYQKANGYFGANVTHDVDGNTIHFDTEFRFQCKQNKHSDEPRTPIGKEKPSKTYAWDELSFFTSWQKNGSYLMLCFDLPSSAEQAMFEALRARSRGFDAGPFLYHSIMVAAAITLFDTSVWSWRDEVRVLEEQRPSVDVKDKSRMDYIRMHELSRHLTHSTESLDTALTATQTMLDTLHKFIADEPSLSSCSSSKVAYELMKQQSLLKCIQNRSKALEDRLAGEISLAFHIKGQWDSQLAFEIAKLAREDSEITKTIAVLGLLFLPGTLISAIFSTSFFNFTPATQDTPGRWSVSESFWIYWVTTAVVTVITIIIWTAWQRTWRSLSRTHENTNDMTALRPIFQQHSPRHLTRRVRSRSGQVPMQDLRTIGADEDSFAHV